MKINVSERLETILALTAKRQTAGRLTRREWNNLQRAAWELQDYVTWLERNARVLEEAWLVLADPDSSSAEKEEAREAIEEALAYDRNPL